MNRRQERVTVWSIGAVVYFAAYCYLENFVSVTNTSVPLEWVTVVGAGMVAFLVVLGLALWLTRSPRSNHVRMSPNHPAVKSRGGR